MINKNYTNRFFLVISLILFIDTYLISQNTAPIKPIRIIVEDFRSTGKVENSINTDISGFLKLSLSQHPDIELITENGINPDKMQSRNEQSFEDFDCLVTGSFNVNGNNIVIPVNLSCSDTANRKVYSGDVDKIGKLMDDLSRNVYESILGLVTKKKPILKNVTILFQSDSRINAKDLEYLNGFTHRLIAGFPVVSKIKMYNWHNKEDFFKKSEQDIFDGMHLDAFYKLTFLLNSGEISSVSPVLVARDKDNGSFDKIALPDYSTGYYKKYDFEQFLIRELSDFLNSYVNLNQENEKIFNIASFNVDKLLDRANNASSGGDYARSDYYLYKILEKNPDLSEADKIRIYNHLGQNKINQYRIEEAEEEYNKVLAIKPDDYRANIGIIQVRVDQNNFVGALRKADAMVPPTSEVFLLKGQAYMGLNRFEDAERSFKKIPSTGNPEITKKKMLFLGSIYLETEQTDKAYDIYKELYELDSSNSNIAYLYGYLLGLKGLDEFNIGNYSGAAGLLSHAENIYGSTDVTDYLRLAYINERRFDDAMDLIEQKIIEGKYSTDDIYMTHALDIRDIFIDTSQQNIPGLNEFGEQALKAIDLHLKYNPDDPNGYFYKGNTLTRMGNDSAGLAQMEIAYEKNKNDEGVQLDLMELYILNGKFNKCEEIYDAIMQHSDENKIDIQERDLALMNYLLITSLKIRHKDFKKPERKLDRLLKKGAIVDKWSYGPYIDWLAKSNFDDETKTFLTNLTNKMKSHNKSG